MLLFPFSLLLSLSSVLILFLMLSPPPCSTLFPYTTLFRSCTYIAFNGQVRPIDVISLDMLHDDGSWHGYVSTVIAGAGLDRKSTRLNSSHVASSYAVFCLKKKREFIHSDALTWTKHTHQIR